MNQWRTMTFGQQLSTILLVLTLGIVVQAQAVKLPNFGKAAAKAQPAPHQQDRAIQPDSNGVVGQIPPSKLAYHEIPEDYLRLYQETARKFQKGWFGGYRALGTTRPVRCQIDWRQLAGHGAIESGHGQSTKPGVQKGINEAGCCKGPMQMSAYRGEKGTEASSIDIYMIDGNGDGFDVYSPEDAIPTAANHLCDRPTVRAPEDPYLLTRSIIAYYGCPMNDISTQCWNYLRNVMGKAADYGIAEGAPMGLLKLPNLQFGPLAKFDLTANRIDPDLVAVFKAIPRRFKLGVDIIYTGHCLEVGCNSGRLSLHGLQRAADIYYLNGQPVSDDNVAAKRLLQWLTRYYRELPLNEIGHPFRRSDEVFFTDPGHQDHFHFGVT